MIVRNSPNQGARPAGTKIIAIVIHGTHGRDAGDQATIMNPAAEVSYHTLILRDGTEIQYVPDERRAWHAGVSALRGRQNVNDFSLGVGLSNMKGEPYTDAQYERLGRRLGTWMDKHGIQLANIVGHYHVSPGRKTDPWETFEWGRAFGSIRRAGTI